MLDTAVNSLRYLVCRYASLLLYGKLSEDTSMRCAPAPEVTCERVLRDEELVN